MKKKGYLLSCGICSLPFLDFRTKKKRTKKDLFTFCLHPHLQQVDLPHFVLVLALGHFALVIVHLLLYALCKGAVCLLHLLLHRLVCASMRFWQAVLSAKLLPAIVTLYSQWICHIALFETAFILSNLCLGASCRDMSVHCLVQSEEEACMSELKSFYLVYIFSMLHVNHRSTQRTAGNLTLWKKRVNTFKKAFIKENADAQRLFSMAPVTFICPVV